MELASPAGGLQPSGRSASGGRGWLLSCWVRHRRGTAFTAVGAIERHRVGRCADASNGSVVSLGHEPDIIFLPVAGLIVGYAAGGLGGRPPCSFSTEGGPST